MMHEQTVTRDLNRLEETCLNKGIPGSFFQKIPEVHNKNKEESFCHKDRANVCRDRSFSL